MPELFLCGAVLIFIKYGFIERAVLMCNDRGADRVAGNVDRSSRHIKNTVDTHDQPMPATGRPTESNTIASVIRPTDGTPAVPMDARVAVAITVR